MMMDVGCRICKHCQEPLRAETVTVHTRTFTHRKTGDPITELYLEVVYSCPEHGVHVEPQCSHNYREMPGYMFEHKLFCRSCGHHIIQDSSG